MLELRVRVASGDVRSVLVAEDGDALLSQVAHHLQLPIGTFHLLHGFPPRPLEDKKTARELGVAHNDLLTLRALADPSGAVQGKAGALRRAWRKKRDHHHHGRHDGMGEKNESKQQVAEKLVRAFRGGARDDVATFLRRAARQAVATQYEIRAGNDRFMAALGNKFHIKRNAASSAAQSVGGSEAEVEYAKGSRGAKGLDRVKIMTQDALKATLQYILAVDDQACLENVRELIRPAKMAEVSPSTFWSLVDINGGGTDLESKLEEIAPEIDWSFLGARKRLRSEKALQAEENARIAEEEKQKRKLLAEQRRIKRQKKMNGAESKESEGEDVVSNNTILDILDGNKQLMDRLAKDGLCTLLDICDKSEEDLVKYEISGEMIHSLQTAAVDQLVEGIVPEESLRTKLAELQMATPYDLLRLRVPGRIEFTASETSVSLDLVREWQRKAQDVVAQHPWLKGFRTSG